MAATFKELTNFFSEVGANDVQHSDKTYLAHAISVYNDLKKWGADDELALVGLFHSIYGTELFQGFTLDLERRGEVEALIGVRAERISYYNCAMNRAHFDAQVPQKLDSYSLLDRFTDTEIAITTQDFHDLCFVHLCDWLEQVARSANWDYRRDGYQNLAFRLGGIALESYNRVFGNAPTQSAEIIR